MWSFCNSFFCRQFFGCLCSFVNGNPVLCPDFDDELRVKPAPGVFSTWQLQQKTSCFCGSAVAEACTISVHIVSIPMHFGACRSCLQNESHLTGVHLRESYSVCQFSCDAISVNRHSECRILPKESESNVPGAAALSRSSRRMRRQNRALSRHHRFH